MGYAGLKPIDPITIDPSTSVPGTSKKGDPDQPGPGWIHDPAVDIMPGVCPRYSSSSVAWNSTD